MVHQFHHGKKFYLDKKKGYWISTTYPRIRAHVWVWKYNNGNIEKGFHIHHRDEDRSNNEIENLELLSAAKHLSGHMTEERKAQVREHAERIRPLTKKWHASDEGRKWHRSHGILGWENRDPVTKECSHCGKEYSTKTFHQAVCSNKCKSAARRKSKIDDINVICQVCTEVFRRNKYARQVTCSRTCGGIFKSKEYRGSRG